MATRTYIPIVTLNINGLNAPSKRHRLAEWLQKQDPFIVCLQETHIRPKDTYRLKVRGWKKNIFHANGKQRKAGVAILISDKIDLKDYKLQGRTLHSDQRISPRGRQNIGKYLCTQHRSTLILTDIKGEIDSNTIIVGEFSTPLTPMDRS